MANDLTLKEAGKYAALLPNAGIFEHNPNVDRNSENYLYNRTLELPEPIIVGTNKALSFDNPHYNSTAGFLGLLMKPMNSISPSSQIGAVRGMLNGQGYWNSLYGDNNLGVVSKNFAQTHPYLSMGTNIIFDALTGLGLNKGYNVVKSFLLSRENPFSGIYYIYPKRGKTVNNAPIYLELIDLPNNTTLVRTEGNTRYNLIDKIKEIENALIKGDGHEQAIWDMRKKNPDVLAKMKARGANLEEVLEVDLNNFVKGKSPYNSVDLDKLLTYLQSQGVYIDRRKLCDHLSKTDGYGTLLAFSGNGALYNRSVVFTRNGVAKPHEYLHALETVLDDALAQRRSNEAVEAFTSDLLNNRIFVNGSNPNPYTEISARFSQFKNVLGITDNTPITGKQLKWLSDHYVSPKRADNNMTEFFKGIKDYDKAAKWGSEWSYKKGGILQKHD